MNVHDNFVSLQTRTLIKIRTQVMRLATFVRYPLFDQENKSKFLLTTTDYIMKCKQG